MNSQQLIDSFNEGDYGSDIGPLFGGVVNFLKFANKHNFINELLLENIPYNEFDDALEYLDTIDKTSDMDYEEVPEEFKNTLLLYQLEKDPNKTLQYICDRVVSDVYPMNGGYYLHIKDRTELAELFETYHRETSPHDVAKSVLGEDYWEPFWDTTDDVYGDVIEDLDDTNLGHLSNYILKELGNQELSTENYDDGLFHQFSDAQGTEGKFQITKDNVMRLIKDKDAMNELLKGDLSDLKSELYSIHSNAYNTAYTDEIYKDVWDGISEYFEPKSWEYETKERYDGKKIQHEYIKINDFPQIIYDFLSQNKGQTYNESFLEYWNSFVGVIASLMEDGKYSWLNFRVPDYADWTLTKKYVNDIFSDYI